MENKINKVLKEALDKFIKENVINEGIDIYPNENPPKVAFNPTHQEYVDTNDPWNPKPIYNEINGYKVISIFERKSSDDRLDGNPLIYALKGHNWEFKNPHYDLMSLLRRFVAVTKELQGQYDVIITTPSSNKLNNEILRRVSRLIPHSNEFEHFFTKLAANDVYENWLYTNWFDEHPDIQHSTLLQAVMNMNKYNNGVFSYKFIKPIELRNAIKNSMKVSDEIADDLSMGDYINGKNVLVIDDTVTSGKTISDSANAILQMFDPKSITFLTLFSPLNQH